LTPFDLPGPTSKKVACERCGQVIRDHREVEVNGVTLCKPCAQGPYFKNAREVLWEDMNWTPAMEEKCGDTFTKLPPLGIQNRKHAEKGIHITPMERAANV